MTERNCKEVDVYRVVTRKIEELKGKEISGSLLQDIEIDLLVKLISFRKRCVSGSELLFDDYVLVNMLLRGADEKTKIQVYRSFIIELFSGDECRVELPARGFDSENEKKDAELIMDLIKRERLTIIPDCFLSSKKFIRKAIETKPRVFQKTYDFKSDDKWQDVQKKIIMTKAVRESDKTLNTMNKAGSRVFSEPVFMNSIVERNPLAIRFASPSLKSKDSFTDIAIKAVSGSGRALQYVPKEFWTSELLNEAAKDPDAMPCMPDELRESRKYLYYLAEQGKSDVLKYVREELGNDRGLVLGLLGYGVDFLEFAGNSIKSDKGVASVAVTIDPTAVRFFAEDIRGDRCLITKCIQRNREGAAIIIYATDSVKSDKRIALEAVRRNGAVLLHLPEELKRDPEIVFEAVRENYTSFQFADDSLRKEPDFVKAVCHVSPGAVAFAKGLPKELEKYLLLEAIRQDEVYLRVAPKQYKEDIDFLSKAIIANVRSYCYFLDCFQKDYGFRRIAFKNGVVPKRGALEKEDRSIVLSALSSGEISGRDTYLLAKKYKFDREIALKLLECNKNSFRFLSKKLRKDKQIVLNALQRTGLNLKFVDKGLVKENPDIVTSAILVTGQAIIYAPDHMRRDRTMVLKAYRHYKCGEKSVSQDEDLVIYNSLPDCLRQDTDIIHAAIHVGENVLEGNNWEIRSNQEIVHECVKKDGQLLQYATMGLRNDRQIVLNAVRKDGMALEHASEELRMDKEVVLSAVNSNPDAIQYALGSIKMDRQIVNKMRGYQYLDEELRDDEEVALNLLKRDKRNFSEMSERLQKDANLQETFIRFWGVDSECAGGKNESVYV